MLGLVWLLVSVSAVEAHAQWFVTPWVGLKFGGSTNLVDLEQSAAEAKLLLGGSGGVLGSGIFGIEADYGYGPRFFERTNEQVGRSSITTLMGNVIIALPRRITRDSLRPYIVGGVGLIHTSSEEALGVFDINRNLLGLSVGGGAIGPVTNRVSIRFDLRRFSNLTAPREPALTIDEEPANLTFWRATVGVVFQY
ncbi:MAG TPA: outer membrane beta-barrel protein [Vicinamibacterales bacterium]